jgi:hypothetical protein
MKANITILSKKRQHNIVSNKIKSKKPKKTLKKSKSKSKSNISSSPLQKIDVLKEAVSNELFFKLPEDTILKKNFGNFANILFHGKLEKFMSQFNHNDVYFEQQLIKSYTKFKMSVYHEYRVVDIPTPYPIFMTNDLINQYYKKSKSRDLCLIANTYTYLVPFLLFNFDDTVLNQLKKIKLMLFKNVIETNDREEYKKKEAIFNSVRQQNRIELEGNFEYDIDNYLLDYIKNPNSITKKYKTIFLLKGFYMDFVFPTKVYNYILTCLFNLEVSGDLIIQTALTIQYGDYPDFFVFLTSLFNNYELIRQKNNDYMHEYPYLYKFYNFKGISTQSLIELSKLIINSNKTTAIDFTKFSHITKKDVNNGVTLLSKLNIEKNKYEFFMINMINYFKNNPLYFLKCYGNMVMNRIFILYNNIYKFKVTYNLKELNKCVNNYFQHICCFDEYYRSIDMSFNRYYDFISIDKEKRLVDKLVTHYSKYSFDFIYRFIFDIDVIKQLSLNCINTELNNNQTDLIDNNINKSQLVDVIINNFKTFYIPVKKYLINHSLFVEHYEILSNYIPILKKINTSETLNFNYFHFGQSSGELQFISSFNYFIKNNYQNRLDLSINIYTNITKKSFGLEEYKIHYINNENIEYISDNLAINNVNFISSDEVIDVEIDGYNLKYINQNFSNDSFISDFNIDNESAKEINDSIIKDLEYHEFYKLCMVISTLSVGGSCCIKHLAIPLNSYLIYKGHYETSGFFINYLYIYSQLFQNITLYKPSTSPNESLEFYVIGTNFIGIDFQLKTQLLNVLNNFELHQTFFKKEDINNFFLKDIELFLELMTNRFVDYEKIKSLLKGGFKQVNSSNDFGFKKNEIFINLSNNARLKNKLSTNIYDNWKNKYLSNLVINFKKVYYFTQVDETMNNNQQILNFHQLEELLDKNDFTQMNNKYDAKDTPHTLSFIHTYLPRKNFTIPVNTYLINIINDSFLTSKNILYSTSLNYNQKLTTKYINESYILDFNKPIIYYNHLFKNNQIWYIKKPNKSNGIIISSSKELETLFNSVTIKSSKNKSLKKIASSSSSSNNSENMIIEKYTINPLLYDKKKFNIRMFYIVFIDSKNKITSFLSKYGLILTAKNDYNNDPNLYHDLSIHNPTVSFTKDDYIFPNDFKKEFGEQKTKTVTNNMIDLFQFISKMQINNISNFTNTQNGYTILTSDLTIDTDLNVKIIDLNSNIPLYTKNNDANIILSNHLYGNIYKEIIAHVFNLEKTKINEKFIPILSIA